MKIKNFLNIILISTALLIFSSCGYKNVNLQNENNISINEIKISGNKKIGYILKNEILLISSNQGNNKLNLNLKIDKTKTINDKNTSGKIIKYDLNLNVDIFIENLNNSKTTNKNFFKSVSFDVSKKHSDTINNEKNNTKNLTNQMAEEIINYLRIYSRN